MLKSYDITSHPQDSPSNLCWTFTNIFRHKPWKLEAEQLAMCRKALLVYFNNSEADLQGAVERYVLKLNVY